jgi:signal transduction histidine kinase
MNDIILHSAGENPWFLLAAIALLEAIAVYVWRFRHEPGGLPLALVQVCKAVWLLALLVVGSAVDVRSLIFWMDAGSLAAMALITINFLFLAELWGVGAKTHRWLSGANLVILAVYVAVLITDPWHHAYWRLSMAPGLAPRLDDGPLRTLVLGVNKGLGLGYLIFCLAWIKKERGLRRRQAEMILLAIILSWAGVLLKLHLPAHRAAALPISFVLSSLVVAWAFLRWRLLGLLPLAQETALNERVDGLLMLDQSGRIMVLNKAARALFPSRNLLEGNSFDKAVDDWPALAVLTENRGECQFDVVRQSSTRCMTYEIAQTQLRNSMGHPLGRVVTFTDVTEARREQSQRLQQSILKERKQLGQELHDDGQVWYFLAAQTQTVQYLLQHQEIERALLIVDRMIEVQAERTVGMRESMVGLQSELSESHSLPQAIQEQIDWYRHYCGMDVWLRMDGEWAPERVSLLAQAQLLRIAQEALANARKHAAASSVQLALELQKERLTLSVADDGCGFDAEAAANIEGHFGLKTMRERAESIGGRFELVTAPGAGCRIAVELPLP